MKNFTLKTIVSTPEKAFVLFALVFGLISALLVPQLSNNDENMHFLRAYNLASGTPLNSKTCTYPKAIQYKSWSIYANNYSANYGADINYGDTVTATCGSAAGYSPIMHLPQAAGIFIAKMFDPSTGALVLAGRIGNLIFYALVLYWIIKRARIGKWAFFVIALFPFMIQTAGSLSADVMNNVVVLGVLAYMLNLFSQTTRLTRHQLMMLILCAGLAALTKPTNVLILLPLACLPARLFTENAAGLKRLPFRLFKWGFLGTCAAFSVFTLFLWQKIYGAALVSDIPSSNPLNSHPLHFLKILFNTYLNPEIGYNDIVLRGTVGEFASFRYHLPTYMLILCFALLAFVLLYRHHKYIEDIPAKTLRQLALGSVVALSLLVVVVTYTLYVTWAIQPFRLGPEALYADGVQGRYFTAALGLLVAPFLWIRRYFWIRVSSESLFRGIVMATSCFILVFYSIETVLYFLHG